MNDCPTQEELTAWMDDAQAETLARHVESCPKCRHVLERLGDDPDVSRWREWLASGPAGGVDRLAPTRPWSRQAERTRIAFPPAPTTGPVGRLDNYDVYEEIGSGAMGAVFRAFDNKLARWVAIKVPWPDLAAGGHFRERFEREARAAAAGADDHVVEIHQVADAAADFPHPFLVMELVDGDSLRERLDRLGPLSPVAAAEIARQVALGLAAVHRRGLVHRDVKPSNILLSRVTGRAKLSDFGVARALDGPDPRLTREGVPVGTPAYMSPELIAAPARVDARSDLFSLGAVLYEMLTCERAFPGATATAAIQRVLDADPLPPRRLDGRIPPALETICLRCMARDPDDRYRDAAALADDLRAFGEGRRIKARPLGPAARLLKGVRRHPRSAGLGLAIVVLLGVSAATTSWPPRKQGPATVPLLSQPAGQHPAMVKAYELKLRGELPEAIRLFSTLVGTPEEAEARIGRGWCYHDAGEFIKAQAEFRKAAHLSTSPMRAAHASYGLGCALQSQKDYAGAVDAFRAGFATDPGELGIAFNIGRCYLNLRRFDEAIDAYRRAVAIDPTNTEMRDGLAEALAAKAKASKPPPPPGPKIGPDPE